jgi:hypothetical protein
MSSEAITKNDLTNILNKIVTIDGTDMTAQEIEDFVDGLNISKVTKTVESKELLWINPNPLATFAAQTISLDLSEYDLIEIHAYASVQSGRQKLISQSIEIGMPGAFVGVSVLGTATDTTTLIQRIYNSSTTGVTFAGGAYRAITASTLSDAADVYVPYTIYGIKLVSL